MKTYSIVFNRTVDDVDNLSNHLPVELCFSQYGLNYSTVTDEPVSNTSRILWRCAKRDDILMYQLVLNVELTKMAVNATLCTAVNCEETTHCDAIDSVRILSLRAFMRATCVYKFLVALAKAGRNVYQAGMSMCAHSENNLYCGTEFGLNVTNPTKGQCMIACATLGVHTIRP